MLTRVGRTLIRLLPEPLGIALNNQMANRPRRAAVTPAEQLAIEQATKLHYGDHGRNVAWAWGSGPLVILVHGWGGRGSQLAPLATRIAALGFRAVAIDVTGHGASARHHTSWRCFFNDIAALSRSLNDEVYAYVGHSAGGLAMMAARRLSGIRASRYVCICSPSYPLKSVDNLRRRVAPSEAGMHRFQERVARQFETSWAELQAGSSFDGAGADTLLFYDQRDRFIPPGEGDKIQALCPEARLVKTYAQGHNRILGHADLLQAISEFLTH